MIKLPATVFLVKDWNIVIFLIVILVIFRVIPGIVCTSRHEFSIGATKVEGQGQINSDFCFQEDYTLVGGECTHTHKVKQMV